MTPRYTAGSRARSALAAYLVGLALVVARRRLGGRWELLPQSPWTPLAGMWVPALRGEGWRADSIARETWP